MGQAVLSFSLGLAALALVAAASWRRAPFGSALTWVLAWPAFAWCFRDDPGLFPAVMGMFVVILPLRAFVAALEAPELGAGEYLRYVLDPGEPLPAERAPGPAPRPVIARRAARGLLLAGLSAALLCAGDRLQLWRQLPYLEDVHLTAALVLGGTGFVDLCAAGAWLAGRPIPQHLHDGSFVRATSLRDFWRRWNGMVSTVLAHGLYSPIARRARFLGRRPAMALGVLAAFGYSGLIHALPLSLATTDRGLNVRLMAATMLFFLLHAVGCLLEGAFPAAWLRGRPGRAWVWLVFAGTVWLYPGSALTLFGLDGRPVDSPTILQVLR